MKITKEEIKISNKLIAEFMGWEISGPGFPSGYNNPHNLYCHFEDLEFNHSWDWLMPVVEKIENLGFWTKIQAHTSFDNLYKSCDIKKQKPRSDGDYLYNYEGDWIESKIEAVYNAVVEFIKFYNEK